MVFGIQQYCGAVLLAWAASSSVWRIFYIYVDDTYLAEEPHDAAAKTPFCPSIGGLIS